MHQQDLPGSTVVAEPWKAAGCMDEAGDASLSRFEWLSDAETRSSLCEHPASTRAADQPSTRTLHIALLSDRLTVSVTLESRVVDIGGTLQELGKLGSYATVFFFNEDGELLDNHREVESLEEGSQLSCFARAWPCFDAEFASSRVVFSNGGRTATLTEGSWVALRLDMHEEDVVSFRPSHSSRHCLFGLGSEEMQPEGLEENRSSAFLVPAVGGYPGLTEEALRQRRLPATLDKVVTMRYDPQTSTDLVVTIEGDSDVYRLHPDLGGELRFLFVLGYPGVSIELLEPQR